MPMFPFSPQESTFFLAVIWSALGFFFYFFFSMNEKLAVRLAGSAASEERVSIYSVLIQRLWGVLFMGLIPLLYVSFSKDLDLTGFGTTAKFLNPLPWWTWILLIGILALSFFNAGAKTNLERYPMIRVRKWSYGLVTLSAVSWIAYLVAYEFFFRGILLYAALTLLGPWPAIAINIAIYGYAHMYKGAGEAFGAIPLGVVFCLLTLITGNFWTVIILHVVMALSNEWLSLWKQPEMSISRRV